MEHMDQVCNPLGRLSPICSTDLSKLQQMIQHCHASGGVIRGVIKRGMCKGVYQRTWCDCEGNKMLHRRIIRGHLQGGFNQGACANRPSRGEPRERATNVLSDQHAARGHQAVGGVGVQGGVGGESTGGGWYPSRACTGHAQNSAGNVMLVRGHHQGPCNKGEGGGGRGRGADLQRHPHGGTCI